MATEKQTPEEKQVRESFQRVSGGRMIPAMQLGMIWRTGHRAIELGCTKCHELESGVQCPECGNRSTSGCGPITDAQLDAVMLEAIKKVEVH